MKRIGRFVRRNLWIILFALFICIGVWVSAYPGSDVPGVEIWNVNITHAPSTSTPTLAPDVGWWSEVATPDE